MKPLLLCIAVASIAAGDVGAKGPVVTWYLATKALNDAGKSLNLGDAMQEVDLNAGWSCTVGETSKQLPSYEARETLCRNSETSFEFSVMCDRKSMKDHTQIRFYDLDERFVDVIEVDCELRE